MYSRTVFLQYVVRILIDDMVEHYQSIWHWRVSFAKELRRIPLHFTNCSRLQAASTTITTPNLAKCCLFVDCC